MPAYSQLRKCEYTVPNNYQLAQLACMPWSYYGSIGKLRFKRHH